ncbi:MAG: phosphocholine cytidylyltransferase family protein [Proteobacteria bacterium]|nr:phosphocholine cytidylyltransferase family protein [Pseudomonadota bacterium]
MTTKAIILAAGRGSRMKSLTDDRPKCLVEFRGKPLLHWQLEALRTAGVCDIALVTGYRRDALAGFGLREFHNERWAETNMVTSLSCAREWLESGDCIVSYSDIVYKRAAVDAVLGSEADLAVAYDLDWLRLWTARFGDPLKDAETFRIDETARILEIGQKPASVAEIQGQYMGLLHFRPVAWQALQRVREGLGPARRDRLDMTGALQLLILSGYAVFGVPIHSQWAEFDSEEDLLRVGALAP